MPITQDRLWDVVRAAEFYRRELEELQTTIQNTNLRVQTDEVDAKQAFSLVDMQTRHRLGTREHDRVIDDERAHYKHTNRKNAANRKYQRKLHGTQPEHFLTGPEAPRFVPEDPHRRQVSLHRQTNPDVNLHDLQPIRGLAQAPMNRPGGTGRLVISPEHASLFDAQGNLKEDDPRQVQALREYEALRTQSGAEQLTPELVKRIAEIDSEGGDWEEGGDSESIV